MMPGMAAIESLRAAGLLVRESLVLFYTASRPRASMQAEPKTARLDKPFSTNVLQAAVRPLV